MCIRQALKKIWIQVSVITLFLGACHARADQATSLALVQSQSADIIGIEFLFATPNSGPIYTRFGHALFRLVNPKLPLEKNLVVSFAASVDDQNVDYIKGLIGSYSVVADVNTLEDTSLQYNENSEQRIERYILALKPTELQNFLANLVTWMKSPDLMGDYTFLSNNCAGALSRLFMNAGILADGTIFPDRLSGDLNMAGVSPFPVMEMPSSAISWAPIEATLGVTDDQFKSLKSITSAQVQELLAQDGPTALARLLYNDPTLDDPTKALLRTALLPYFSQLNLDDLMNIHPVPSVLYQAPESPSDFAAINQARSSFFGSSGLRTDLMFLSAISAQEQPSAYAQLETQRIQSDPNFRKYVISENFENLSPSQGAKINVDGSDISLSYSVPNSDDPLEETDEYDLGGSISTDGQAIHIGDLVCPIDASSRTGLTDDCALIYTRVPGGSTVAISGFKAGSP